MGKATTADVKKAQKLQETTDDNLLTMLKELSKQDISEFETTIKKYEEHDSRKFDVARSFLYKLIDESEATKDEEKTEIQKIITKKESRLEGVFGKSQITNTLITIRNNVSDSADLQKLLKSQLQEECFDNFKTSVTSLGNTLFTLENNSSILKNLKQCKEALDKALQTSTDNAVAANLQKMLDNLNKQVVNYMIKLPDKKYLLPNKLKYIPNKLANINESSECGKYLFDYFNSVQILYEKMELYYPIHLTLEDELQTNNNCLQFINGFFEENYLNATLTTFKKYKQHLEIQGYGAVNTFISTLEKNLNTSEHQSNNPNVLAQSLTNAKDKPLGAYIELALDKLYQYATGTMPPMKQVTT